MNKLPGYKIEAPIKIASNKIIYRGQRKSDKKPVIIKTLTAEYPSLEEITRLKQEYQISQQLNLEGVIKVYSLEKYLHSFALILEDIDGESLKDILGNHSLSVTESLTIALQLAQALGELHHKQIIHKDIKPSNIIINLSKEQVKITDFSIATCLSRETHQPDNQSLLEGTLAYMSPEQTGRMNRSIDYRSDFYSLGVTIYEMVTGQLPFNSNDPLELIHYHIAVKPIAPHQLNPSLPKAVSAIIMKLLAKNAEDRYQSTQGLQADLETCLIKLQQNSPIEDFKPGKLDQSSQLLIPQKLYGRTKEVTTLMNAFARISSGRGEIILVSGYSGVGKTSVIKEIHKPIVQQRGYFITGKFDQLKRNIPYAGIIQAFESLLQQLLTQTKEQIEIWKEKILTQLGENAQVLIEIIPEVELIIGDQPAVEALGATEAQNRFNRILKTFIEIFTQPEHPLVIFLDDLQWADSASLKLIELLMNDSDSQHLLLIGAYRDNEVSPIHPLMQTREKLQQKDIVINQVILEALSEEHVTQLVAETIKETPEKAKTLAQLLFHKTGGNPFFLTQLLQTLQEEELLTFDFQQKCWQWDTTEIQKVGITDYNVVELIARNLQKLPSASQKVLKLAACIGNRFNLEVVSIINEKTATQTAADLWPALQIGLILPLSDAYKLPLVFEEISENSPQIPPQKNQNSPKITYKFLHDRVQQAAYSLIPEAQRQKTHRQIGQLLLEHIPIEEREDKIFELVNQLNIAQELLNDPQEKEQLAQLNLIAGQKAKGATAYEVALEYFNVGLKLLPEDSWQNHYQLTLNLYIETVGAQYLNANFSMAQELSTVVLNQALTLLDKVRVYEIKIQYHIAQNQMQAAIETALPVLKLLDINLPSNPQPIHILLGLLKTKLTQGRRKIEDLATLPLMKEAKKLAALRILMSVIPATFVAMPNLFPLVIFNMVNLSLKYGNAPISSMGYGAYGVIHCGVIGDIKGGYRYGQLTLKLLEQFEANSLKAQIYLAFNTFIRPWKEHIRETLEPLLEGVQSGIETGVIEDACYCATFYCGYLLVSGESLEIVNQKQSQYLELLVKYQQEYQIYHAQLWNQVVQNLQGKTENPAQLVGEIFNEVEILPKMKAAENNVVLFVTYVGKLWLCYLFEDYQQALDNAEQAQKYLQAGPGNVYVALHNFYYSLALLEDYPNVGREGQKKYLEQVRVNQKKMKHWAMNAPMNYQHKYELVEAQRAKLLGNKDKAGVYYDRAIKGAKKERYLQEEALGLELAAKFYFENNREKLAQVYLTDAYYSYAHWGAKAKVQQLEEKYADFFSRLLVTPTPQSEITLTNRTTSSISRDGYNALDLATVMKASQAISEEIVLEQLLHKLMQILMESAGAQKGFLLLRSQEMSSQDEGSLLLAAEGQVEPDQVIVLPFTHVSKNSDLPISLINYVQRTKEIIVLNKAPNEGLFNRDPYIMKHQPQSILGLPIIHQGQLLGILYLENRLTQDAFTSDRLEVLSLLSAQASISLENALMYSSLEDKVTARTQELEDKNLHLKQTLQQLQQTQLQLIQTEKMSSLGQLVAGIAHEINNPVNFIYGNLSHTNEYLQDLLNLIELYQQHYPQPAIEIQDEIETIELEFLVEDLPKILDSMKVGATRIKEIVKSLRNFSRLDEAEMKPVDIHEGIDNTLLILQNRLKAKPNHPTIEVIKEYGQLPEVECYASALNQVFLHILANAIDALEMPNIDQLAQAQIPTIWIRTEVVEDQQVFIHITDNGTGMKEEIKKHLFDPFFTTKPVGQGTGMGLSISYQIIVEKHNGKLECISNPGQGSEFIIQIPIQQLAQPKLLVN